MGELLATAIQAILTFIRFGINVLFVVAIVGLSVTLLINLISAINGFVGLMIPWEGSLLRDIYLLISIWSPVNFGVLFNHVILLATTIYGIFIFTWVQRMFNTSWGNN